MAKLITFLASFIMLTGCGIFGKEIVVEHEYVEVAVEKPVVPEKPPEFENPGVMKLPVYDTIGLSEKEKDFFKQVSEKYFQTIIILIGEINKRDNVLDKYRDFKIYEEGEEEEGEE